MRKNVKNDKVLKAITIGLATMIAATSMPMNVYALDGEPEVGETEPSEEPSGETESSEEPSGEPNASAEESAADFTVTDTNLVGEKGGIAIANDLLDSQTVSIDSATNEPIVGIDSATGKAIGSGLLPTAIDAAVEAGQTVNADDGITTASEDLITAAGAVVKTEQALENVEGALKNLKQGDATNPVAPIEYVGETQSDEKSSTEVKVLPEDGNEHLKTKTETDEDGNVSVTPDVFDNDGNIVLQAPADDDCLVASFYNDYSEAIQLANKGDAASLQAAFVKADEAERKLKNEKAKVENLKEAIKDSNAAEKAVAAAKKKLEIIEGIRTTYEDFMNTYYKNKNDGAYKADEFESQAVILYNKDQNEEKKYTDGKNHYDTSGTIKEAYDKGNELAELIVKLELLEEGATDIAFGTKQKETSLGDNGRYNYTPVTYKDKDGNKCARYYNDAFKDPFYGETLEDLKEGVIYISERFDTDGDGTPDTEWQKYKDLNRKNYLDNYTALPTTEALNAAKQAVEDAKEKARILREKVYALAKAATGAQEPASIDAALDKAEDALKNSEQKLNVLYELLGYLSDRMPEKETIVNPRPQDTDPAGGDEDPGTSGGTPVFDPGTGTLTIPGYVIPPISVPVPSGVAGVRRGTSSGVAGVRSDNIEDKKDIVRKIVEPQKKVATVNNKKAKLAKIEDPEIPLAEIPNIDDEVTMNWMWLLIIFLLGATGKKMYDEYKKKKEAEEAAKNIND